MKKSQVVTKAANTSKAAPKANKTKKPAVLGTHNKSFPVVKTNRTNMLKILNSTGGRIFTSTHIGKNGEPHTINAIRYKKQNNEFGYIEVYSIVAKEMRLINPQTLTTLSFQKTTHTLKK